MNEATYGIAVRDGNDSRWNIVWLSLPLWPAFKEQIIGRTDVGRKAEESFEGGAGYFGKVADGSRAWALICRYKRSKDREATGDYSVQRSIILIAWSDFIEHGADALYLLDLMPEAEVSPPAGNAKSISDWRSAGGIDDLDDVIRMVRKR